MKNKAILNSVMKKLHLFKVIIVLIVKMYSFFWRVHLEKHSSRLLYSVLEDVAKFMETIAQWCICLHFLNKT